VLFTLFLHAVSMGLIIIASEPAGLPLYHAPPGTAGTGGDP